MKARMGMVAHGAAVLAALVVVSPVATCQARAAPIGAVERGGVTFLPGDTGAPAVDNKGARPMPLPSAPPPGPSDLLPSGPMPGAALPAGNSAPGRTGSGALDLKGRP